MSAHRTIEAKLVPYEWIPPDKDHPESLAVPSEAARDLILQLSLASTKLCGDLNEQISQHPDFETWKKNKSIPDETLKAIWNSLRATSIYQNMPERFARSAWLRIATIYTSWFKIQAKLLGKLYGLKRWLSVAKSDQQLTEISQRSIEQLQSRANQLLSEVKLQLKEQAEKVEGNEQHSSQDKDHERWVDHSSPDISEDPKLSQDTTLKKDHSLLDELFKLYFNLVNDHGSVLDQCAIAHLIKNGCKVASEPENLKEFVKRCKLKQKQVERYEKQLSERIPRVRDLGEKAEKAIDDAVQRTTVDNIEFVEQLAKLQRKPNPLPYAVLFYSGDDVEWHSLKRRNPITQVIEERIFVKFRGLNKYLRNQIREELETRIEEFLVEPGLKLDDIQWKILKRKNKATQQSKKYISFKLKEPNDAVKKQLQERFKEIDLDNQYNMQKQYVFEVCCDRRQLPDFQVFLNDWQIYSENTDQYSLGSIALKSVALAWRQSDKNSTTQFQAYLKCTLDQQELTIQGAALARYSQTLKLNKKIENYEKRQIDGEILTDKHQQDLKKTKSQLVALQNPYPRPSKPPYQGNPDILVGVCLSWETVATVAVIDCSTQKVLADRSDRQLLGKDYKHLTAYRLEQRKNASERHKQQKRGKVSKLSESNKGKHLDRVIAKRIVEVAQTFNAGSIVVPNLTGLRESLQSELEAKAAQKHPGDRAEQKKYEKQYKINLHKWSYGRLIKSIEERASKVGVPVQQWQQSNEGNFQERAVQVALSAYSARKPVET